VTWADGAVVAASAAGYREFAPPAGLSGALHCLWVSVTPPLPGSLGEPAAGGHQDVVLPDACTDLIWHSETGVFVAGPDTGPAPFLRQPGTVLVGARFRPGAGGAALGVPLKELADLRVDGADLPAVPDRRLPGGLPPGEAVCRVALAAAEMVARRPPDRLVLEAARLLDRPGARADLVAKRLEISERQLRRRCQDAVGYGPALLYRVLRFRRFLSCIDAGTTDLAGIAADAGYADQPHLTRESSELAGLPPAALARTRGRANPPGESAGPVMSPR
jgi:AraC-like DNA-binding protein